MNHPQIPIVIDFEASGFGSQSYPIEVGVALESGERYCSLIRPVPLWIHWDPGAEALHRISRNQLFSIGRDVALVARELNSLLAGKRVYTDAWSVDKPWLICLFTAAKLCPNFELSPIESIQTESQHERWDKVYQEELKEMSSDRHRASNDALLIQNTYRKSRDAIFYQSIK